MAGAADTGTTGAGSRVGPWALPAPCALCSSWTRGGLCAACRARFVDHQPPRCPRCALPAAGGAVCGTCLRTPPPQHGCVAAVDYGFPWDRLIARFKFQDQPELAGLLAALLHDAVAQAGVPAPHWVLPVPLSPARLAERGYNQAWELARRVAGQLSLRAHADGLQRLDGEQHQVGASRGQRLQQLREAFWVQPGQRPALAGARVALVDDVVTTGATAEAATLALQRAGVASVQLWMLARTPPPD